MLIGFDFKSKRRPLAEFVTYGVALCPSSTNSIGTIMVHLYAGKSACNASACVLSLSLSPLKRIFNLKNVRLYAL
jgi:hypothetical protein